jgi:hypothetical protein
VTATRLPALGYLYVALALPALLVGKEHRHAAAALLTGAAFAYLWFLVALRARLIRYDPDGIFASTVVIGAPAFISLQALAVLTASPELAGPAAASAATVIVGSSLAAWRARKIPRWFGQAGVAGGLAVLVVGFVESAAGWTFEGDTVFASSLGFMIWVLVATTYLLRR